MCRYTPIARNNNGKYFAGSSRTHVAAIFKDSNFTTWACKTYFPFHDWEMILLTENHMTCRNIVYYVTKELQYLFKRNKWKNSCFLFHWISAKHEFILEVCKKSQVSMNMSLLWKCNLSKLWWLKIIYLSSIHFSVCSKYQICQFLTLTWDDK